jgi:hypothetical protein
MKLLFVCVTQALVKSKAKVKSHHVFLFGSYRSLERGLEEESSQIVGGPFDGEGQLDVDSPKIVLGRLEDTRGGVKSSGRHGVMDVYAGGVVFVRVN